MAMFIRAPAFLCQAKRGSFVRRMMASLPRRQHVVETTKGENKCRRCSQGMPRDICYFSHVHELLEHFGWVAASCVPMNERDEIQRWTKRYSRTTWCPWQVGRHVARTDSNNCNPWDCRSSIGPILLSSGRLSLGVVYSHQLQIIIGKRELFSLLRFRQNKQQGARASL